MSVISLQKSIIYGPVPSRRLGPSLGVNVLPLGAKMCSFDCLYCQYGRTRHHICSYGGQAPLPSVREVEAALQQSLGLLDPPPGYITLSGNGEPTLHPDFADIVRVMSQLRDKMCPSAKTAILSNSVGCWHTHLREALSQLDVRIMKLDSATEQLLQSYNRPCVGVALHDILDGLKGLEDVVIQALFTAGPGGNLRENHLERWFEVVAAVKPLEVQIYSLDRPNPSRDLEPVAASELETIAQRARALGIAVKAYGPRSGGELPYDPS